MHTHRPRFDYTYTAHILVYTHTHADTAHARIYAVITFHKTEARTYWPVDRVYV